MANDIEELRFNGTRYGINDERLATKAEQDGFYEEMTVGDAEQLVSTRYVNDAEPYNFRTTGGSADVGNRKYLDKIVGGTVAWNQLADSDAFVGQTASVSTDENHITTVTTQVAGGFRGVRFIQELIAGHKYLIQDKNTDTSRDSSVVGRLTSAMDWFQEGVATYLQQIPKGQPFSLVINAVSGGLYASTWPDITASYTMTFDKFQVFDLTQMFGSAVADYIYSLEQATAGAGVAFFRKLFPKDYYAYNAGQLMSVKTIAHNTVGFNQWDEQWEVGTIDNATGRPVSGSTTIRSKNYISVVGGQSYYVKCGTTWAQVFAYDSNKNFITTWGSDGANPKTIPSNARYLKFRTSTTYGTTYKNDVCINLSWSGYRNGEYEPYVKHEYALDSDLELRGIPKLDASNNLYYDGDTYESDGGVERKYRDITIDENTNISMESAGWGLTNVFWIQLPSQYFGKYDSSTDGTVIKNIISNDLVTTSYHNLKHTEQTGTIAFTDNGHYLEWTSTSTTIEEEKAKLAQRPLEIVYELATSTTETAEPYNQIQICDDFGTEEFVDTRDIPVPVGHETRYPANLRDKLQHLPDLADADGYYMIQQSNNDMSLVIFRIPQAPAEDGEYTLKATVSGGTPTYTWESTTPTESEGE